MGKKRKASETEDLPSFISQANAPPPKEDRSSRKKKPTKKSEKPWIPPNYDPVTKTHTPSEKEKVDLSSLNIHQLRHKPKDEKKGDKYARQREIRVRKREEKERFERLKAETEGREYVHVKTKSELRREKKARKKLAKKGQPGLSKAEKLKLAEERKERKKKMRKEAKKAEKAKKKAEEAAKKGEGKDVKNGDAMEEAEASEELETVEKLETAVEDKMDVDENSSSSNTSDSESESESEDEEEEAPKPVLKSNGVTNGIKANGKEKEASESNSSESSSDSDAESGDSAPVAKSNGVKEPAATNGTKLSKPIDSSAVKSYMETHSIKITDPEAPDTTTFNLTLNFSDLPAVDKSHLSAFSAYKTPTPIQAASWQYLLDGRDLIGVAETGSGKTMAFAYPAVQYLCKLPKSERNPKKSGAKVVVVSPTRELAMQIYEQVEKLTVAAGLKDAVVCVYGGVPKDSQRESLKKALVIVATPGRLNDFLEEGAANISQAKYVVLDEADRMLDKGFEDAIRTILGATPTTPNRQTLMFTATWPQSVRQLASTFMTKPVRIGINSPDDGDLRANARITQTVEVLADPRVKESRLINLINAHQRSSPSARNDRILVFALYKKEAARLENFLRMKGVKVGGIHGDLNQNTRTTTLAEFKAGTTPVLVATDVAARGLDIPNVKLVINVTFPLTIEDYVHRIGRTGRAGEVGQAVTFFTDHDKAHSGSLINVLKAANQTVPDELFKFGTTVKKKEHASYGAFYRDTSDAKQATKIKFDD
ncbi:hypothetical protein ABW19_dt0201456 [Dactylella cylindrospora]|nr:hypothetical protein ABW19_dt0201456 [Dactylella cylindrospora]